MKEFYNPELSTDFLELPQVQPEQVFRIFFLRLESQEGLEEQKEEGEQ